MKVAVIGGAGVRAPLLIGSLAKRAAELDVHEVAVYDIDKRKISLILPLAEAVLEQAGNPYRLVVAETAQQAVAGAAAVITTIRAGFEEGRAADERICMAQGVLAQETTGAAGYAFACRSIPALVEYARLTFEANPEAWLLNFTNPAGITTQALHQAGFERVVGICDSADSAIAHVADHLKVDKERIESRVAGLNHLSFTTSIIVDGAERLPELLADEIFLSRAQAVFPPSLLAQTGCYLNEYLYYYLMQDEALSAVLREEQTRGELIVGWNAALLDKLDEIGEAMGGLQGLDHYFAYTRRRNESYMDYATGGARYLPTDDEEGYAGVALDFLQAWSGEARRCHSLCVPNRGALPALEDRDVIEVSCEISDHSLRPLPAEKLPAGAEDLISEVKNYERLAVDSILTKSIETGVKALAAHPLIASTDKASSLFDAFRKVQEASFEDWR